MFTTHRSVSRPGAVTHAAVCRFTTALCDELLLVRGGSLLQVWRAHDRFRDEHARAPPHAAHATTTETDLAGNVSRPALNGFGNGETPSFHDSENDDEDDDDDDEEETHEELWRRSRGDAKTRRLPRLRLYAEWHLQGTVAAIMPIELPAYSVTVPSTSTQGQTPPACALVLAFARARISVVDYRDHSLHTISLFSFERTVEASPTVATMSPMAPPKLAVDPMCRCILMQMYQDLWGVIPLRSADDISSALAAAAAAAKKQSESEQTAQDTKIDVIFETPFKPAFIINTRRISALSRIGDNAVAQNINDLNSVSASHSPDLCNVLDVQFVHGYIDPTLAVLHVPHVPADAAGYDMLITEFQRPRCLLISLALSATDAAPLDSLKTSLLFPRGSALSEDMLTTVHPVLFVSPSLSTGAHSIVPCPKNSGNGFLVLCPNMIIYFSQVCQSGVCLVLNAFAGYDMEKMREYNVSSRMPTVTDYSHLGVALNPGTTVVNFVSETRALVGTDMKLWQLDLLYNTTSTSDLANAKRRRVAMQQPTGFSMTMICTAPCVSSIVGPISHHNFDYTFVGSCNGPSRLLLETAAQKVSPKASCELDCVGGRAGNFVLADIFVGPCNATDMIIGAYSQRPAFTVISASNNDTLISIVEEKVSPTVIRKLKMGGAKSIWTVRLNEDYDSLLVLSGEHKTIVFRAGYDLQYFSKTDFIRNRRTLHIGKISNSCFAQLLDDELLLYDAECFLIYSVKFTPNAVRGSTACGMVCVQRADNTCVVYKHYILNDGLEEKHELRKVFELDNVEFAKLGEDPAFVFAEPAALALKYSKKQKPSKSANSDVSYHPPEEQSITRHVHKDKQEKSATKVANAIINEPDDIDIDLYGEEAQKNSPSSQQSTQVQTVISKRRMAGMATDKANGKVDHCLLDEQHQEHQQHRKRPRKRDASVGYESNVAIKSPVLITLKKHPKVGLNVYKLNNSGNEVTVILSFSTDIVSDLPPLLTGTYRGPFDPNQQVEELQKDKDVSLVENLDQVHLFSFGTHIGDTYLVFSYGGGNIAVYKAYHSETSKNWENDTSGLVFKRELAGAIESLAEAHDAAKCNVQIHDFDNINGHKGVVILRDKQEPLWLIYSDRGELTLHSTASDFGGKSSHASSEQSTKESIKQVYSLAFCTYHSHRCENGFLMSLSSGHLAIASLPPASTMDCRSGMPTFTYKVQGCPQSITYHQTTQFLALVQYLNSEFELFIDVPDQQEHNAPAGYNMAVATPEVMELRRRSRREHEMLTGSIFHKAPGRRYLIQLVDSDSFRAGDSYELDTNEYVTTITTAWLECKQSSSGKREYVVVGTTYMRGEDVATRGRIHVLDVVTVVPQVGRPETAAKLRRVAVEEIKAPVGALVGFNGHLIAGVGSKVVFYDLEEDERLVGVAFHDASVYVTKISVLRSLIAVGDFLKSVLLLAWQEDPPRLQLLGRDHQVLSVAGLAPLVCGGAGAFVASSDTGSLDVLAYNPYSAHTYGGTKLLRAGVFSLGATTNASTAALVTHKMHTKAITNKPLISPSDPTEETSDRQGACVTLVRRDGGLAVLAPLPELMFRRLMLLTTRLAAHAPTNAGLNPRTFRQPWLSAGAAASTRGGAAPGPGLAHGVGATHSSSFIDASLVCEMLGASLSDQNEHAAAIGTTLARVRADLKALQRSCGLSRH